MPHTATLTRTAHEYDDVHSYWFSAPGLTYEAGKHVHVQVGPSWSPRTMRELSFASAPFEDEIRFTVHTGSQTPFKRRLAELTPGESIKVFRTGGSFTLPVKAPDGPLMFVGGGVGMTPFRSLALAASQRKGLDIRVLHVQRGNAHLYREEFDGLVHEYRMVQPEDFVSSVRALAHLRKPRFYLCGSRRLVTAAHKQLREAGVPRDRIKVENFR